VRSSARNRTFKPEPPRSTGTVRSAPPLAQRFKEILGVTPKRLARSHRFTATVFSINPAGPIDWADLASGAGYFDQAHFGHEFREFTGLTPTRYVEVRQRFVREHPGHTLDGWPCQPSKGWHLTLRLRGSGG